MDRGQMPFDMRVQFLAPTGLNYYDKHGPRLTPQRDRVVAFLRNVDPNAPYPLTEEYVTTADDAILWRLHDDLKYRSHELEDPRSRKARETAVKKARLARQAENAHYELGIWKDRATMWEDQCKLIKQGADEVNGKLMQRVYELETALDTTSNELAATQQIAARVERAERQARIDCAAFTGVSACHNRLKRFLNDQQDKREGQMETGYLTEGAYVRVSKTHRYVHDYLTYQEWTLPPEERSGD